MPKMPTGIILLKSAKRLVFTLVIYAHTHNPKRKINPLSKRITLAYKTGKINNMQLKTTGNNQVEGRIWKHRFFSFSRVNSNWSNWKGRAQGASTSTIADCALLCLYHYILTFRTVLNQVDPSYSTTRQRTVTKCRHG